MPGRTALRPIRFKPTPQIPLEAIVDELARILRSHQRDYQYWLDEYGMSHDIAAERIEIVEHLWAVYALKLFEEQRRGIAS